MAKVIVTRTVGARRGNGTSAVRISEKGKSVRRSIEKEVCDGTDTGKKQSERREIQDASCIERDVVTIREAVKRAKAQGLPVSDYCLRKWVRTGVIPVRWIGSKALVFYPSLVAYLRFDSDIPKAPFDNSVDL